MPVIESKVYAATIGAGAGGILSAFILWLLGVTLWGASSAADQAVDAVAAVPTPVSGLVGLCVTLAGTFLAGWAAPHTSRPDLPSSPVPESGTGGYSAGSTPASELSPPPASVSLTPPVVTDPPARGKIR